MPYCPFCGSEASEEDTFCRSCGAMLSGSSLPPQKPKDDGRMTKIIAVTVVLAILFAAVGGVIAYYAFGFEVKTEYNNTYRWSYDNQSFSYEITVDTSYYSKVTGSAIDRSGSISEGRYVIDGKTVFGVCDYIVVDKYITKMCQDFCSMYKEKFGADPTNEQYANFVTAFVQICIEYDNDEANNGREYWRYPLQTLIDKTGDCEDTSILLAALLDAKGIKAGVVLAPGHAMAAISTSDYTPSGDPIIAHHSDIDYLDTGTGVDYYLIETTYDSYYEVGKGIGAQYNVVYLHLYMGSVTDYY